jgi:hypothetical protein
VTQREESDQTVLESRTGSESCLDAGRRVGMAPRAVLNGAGSVAWSPFPSLIASAASTVLRASETSLLRRMVGTVRRHLTVETGS